MAATTSSPVKVGARGTVGSLVLLEIEYFRKLGLDGQQSSRKPKVQIIDHGRSAFSSSSSSPTHKVGSRSPAGGKKKKKKKKKGGTGSGGLFLPSICSVVEIAENSWGDRIPRIGYMNLKHEQS